ncbi:MAG: Rab family GTPase [Promethearchaeota archaeon]
MLLMKICLLGDGAVGKTSLRERYLGKGFKSGYTMTIGADFAVKESNVDGNEIKFQIWDLAGQPRFSSVRELYYKGSVGGLLVYDCTRPESYQNLDGWIEELWKNNGRGKLPLVLIANKVDLREENPDSISPELGE